MKESVNGAIDKLFASITFAGFLVMLVGFALIVAFPRIAASYFITAFGLCMGLYASRLLISGKSNEN